MPTDLKHLDALEYAEQLRPWLQRALQGYETLAILTPDEPPYFAILRGRAQLKKSTREDLDTACIELVQAFLRSADGEPDYVEYLLQLASALKLESLVIQLQDFASRFAEYPHLRMETKRSVLSTLLKLHARLDLSFWFDIHRQFGDELAGSVYSGLFACDPTVAVKFLPKIPDVQPLADAISLQLQRYAEKLDPGPRFSFVRKVKDILPNCGAMLKVAIGEWFAEAGIESMLLAESLVVDSVLPKSNGTAARRNYKVLDDFINLRLPPNCYRGNSVNSARLITQQAQTDVSNVRHAS